MISENTPPQQVSTAAPAPVTSDGSYLDWGAILAGSVFALAISFVLISFGASLGLSLTSPYRGEGVSAAWLAIAAGIWFAWVMVTGFGAGGYVAGRLRRKAGDATPDEVEMRDGGHGLMVWATGALISTVLAASGVGGLVSSGSSAAGTAADVASEVASSDYLSTVLLRGPVQSGDDDAAPATQSSGTTSVDPAVQQEIAGIITRAVTTGDMADRDRDYLAQLVAANSDLGPDEARARVDEVNAEIDAARDTAMEAVESARVAGVVFGFIAVATLLLGAVAAFFAATAGGHHRDQGLGFDALTTRR